MNEYYCIILVMEHDTCMLDLVGQASGEPCWVKVERRLHEVIGWKGEVERGSFELCTTMGVVQVTIGGRPMKV